VTEAPGIVVIGAGPAGLAVGHHLRIAGLRFVILEKGSQAGHSWAGMPTGLSLLSPWRANALPGTRVPWKERNRLASRQEFLGYLDRYARERDLPIDYGVEVESVVRADDGFVLRTSSGERRCRVLVNATGYFHNPYVPPFPGAGTTSILQVHSAAYKDPAHLATLSSRPVRKVLVVGKRITAGQVAVELHDAAVETAVSSRGPIEFARPPWLLEIAFNFYYPLEDLVCAVWPRFLEDSRPPMEAGRSKELIESGRIGTRPDIAELTAEAVVFVDGTREAFDAIVYATGFRPALGHLGGLLPDREPRTTRFEVDGVRNLFLIGLDQQPTSRSRYLRGIREDAQRLVARLVSEAS
jgi:putative flavoprotein involved in K+ transport